MKKNVFVLIDIFSTIFFSKFLFNVYHRDEQKIGPQLGISPISSQFWPRIGLGVESFQKLWSRLGLGLGLQNKKNVVDLGVGD